MRAVSQIQIPPVVVILRGQGLRQCVQFGRGGRVAHAGTEAGDSLEAIMLQRVQWCVKREIAKTRKRNPCDFCNAAEDSQKAFWGDADDREGMLINRDRPADQARVGMESATPERIRENNLVVAAVGTIIGIGFENPPELWLHTKKMKIVRRNSSGAYNLGLRVRGIQVQACDGECSYLTERMAVPLDVLKVVVVYRVALTVQQRRINESQRANVRDLRPRIEQHRIRPGRD